MTGRKLGPLTYALFGLILLFVGGDALAHFTRYRYGETVSAAIQGMTRRYRFLFLVVWVGLAVLGVHLTVGLS